MRRLHLALILISISALGTLSLTPRASVISPMPDEEEILRNAALVFAHAVNTPAAAIPAAVLMRASGIAVIPAATGEGRYHGTGVVSARGARPDYWTPPAVITFEGVIPLNLETPTIDLVLVAQTRRGLDYLIQERFTSAAAHSIVAGPLGDGAPMRIDADLLAYMHFATYFGGVTVDDWVVEEKKASNATLYGRPYSTDDIVRGAGFFHVPPAARAWREALADYFRQMS
jgi:lipid-binding SYLF domain-containing protein